MVVGAPPKQRYAAFVSRSRRVARRDVVEDKVGAPAGDPIEWVVAHGAMRVG